MRIRITSESTGAVQDECEWSEFYENNVDAYGREFMADAANEVGATGAMLIDEGAGGTFRIERIAQ